MSVMTPPSAEKYPNLKKAWDEYGHAIPWESLVDIKINGSYAALAWLAGDEIEYADLESVSGVWEMLNDGGAPVTKKEWLAARCKSACNWLEFPE